MIQKIRTTKISKVWGNGLIKEIQKCEHTSSILYIKSTCLVTNAYKISS